MKNKIIYTILFTTFILFVGSAFRFPPVFSPCDAPLLGASHSGAPGEVNCSGCHSGTPNTGSGTTVFDISMGTTEYIPGETYTATITMNQSGVNKFGFQVIALKDANNSFTGSYTLTDLDNTRIINGGNGKKYVGTTKCGSDAPTTDSIAWSFDWIAPASDEGTITFYLSALATNHNHSTSGDHTYTQTIQLSPNITGLNEVMQGIENSLKIFPNPAIEGLQIQFELKEKASVSMNILNVEGKLLESVFSENRLPGEVSEYVDLKDYAEGIYFIQTQVGHHVFSEKIIVEN